MKIFKERMALFALLLLMLFFWVSMIGAVREIITLSVFAIIGYAICSIIFELCLYGRKEKLQKLIVFFLLMEAIQLIPYVIIFIIREVF